MGDKPIIFSAPMIRALLDGRKTQTRRVLEPRWRNGANPEFTGWRAERVGGRSWQIVGGIGVGANVTAPCAPGDRLWVKETWRPDPNGPRRSGVIDLFYRADRLHHEARPADTWKMPKQADFGCVTPLFMPRWASRLTLTVTHVRVQRLQEISGSDARAEGVFKERSWWTATDRSLSAGDPKAAFVQLWHHIHGPGAWDANPWVCAVTFTVHHCNIADMEAAHG